MTYEIDIGTPEIIDDEYVHFTVIITIDETHEIDELVRMSYEEQYDGTYEWESPNSDLGSLLGFEENDEHPEFQNEDFGEIVDECRSEITNWLNSNMRNRDTKF